MRRARLLLACLLLAGCTSAPPPGPSEDAAPANTFACQPEWAAPAFEPIEAVVRTAAEWQSLWSSICGQQTDANGNVSEPPPPSVNFTTHMVVASFREGTSGGHRVNISDVRETAAEVVVHVVRTSPEAGCPTLQILLHPGDVRVARHSEKPVRFEHEDVIQPCPPQPPPPADAATVLPILERMTCRSHVGQLFDAVARNVSDWAALWAEACAEPIGGTGPPDEPLRPPVNFTDRMVLASFWGMKPTGGFTVDVTSVIQTTQEVIVTVVRSAPGDTCRTTAAHTYPGDIVVVQRAAKPVRFQHTEVVHECEPESQGATEGPWQFTWEPSEVVAPAGPAHFTLRAAANATAPPGQLLPGPWIQLNGSDDAQNLAAAGGVWDAEVLVDAVDRARLTIMWERPGLSAEDPDHTGYAVVEGPGVRLAAGDASRRHVDVQAVEYRGAADAPAGLNVTVARQELTAVFSMGTFTTLDCMENVDLLGNVTAWATDDPDVTVLRAAVGTVQSDACYAGDLSAPHTPRIEIHAGPFATRFVDVVVYEHHSCFCPPRGGWEEHHQRVDMGPPPSA
jgi:protease stability complex PrcB-like protein